MFLSFRFTFLAFQFFKLVVKKLAFSNFGCNSLPTLSQN